MSTIPYTEDAYQLLHEGAIALAQVEANGIRIDIPYLDKTIRKMRRKIKYKEEALEETDVMKLWRKLYRKDFKIGSGIQLGRVLFEEMEYECNATTTEGRPKTDEKTLSTLDIPFVKDYLRIKQFKKALSTNLIGLQREIVNGLVHPFFNLGGVQTYRSSSEAFNFQNIPVRDPEIAELIRACFIARDGRRLSEKDYGGIEIHVAACYHKDPNMLAYLNDKTKDMHRDVAMECFILEEAAKGFWKEKNGKTIRYCGKNMFVFPQFYGDYYINCARDLWDAVTKLRLKGPDGKSLLKHLRQQGIHKVGNLDPESPPTPGTFEHHIKSMEKNFWEKRFAIYAQWKRDWYEKYQRRGWIQMLTGFICQGYMRRNQVINYGIQGPAFHCLLRSLIRTQEEIKKAKMQSLIVGQIHDSILGDIPEEERDDYDAMCQEIMVDELKENWKWFITPIEIETEVTPIGGRWSDKEKIKC